MSKTNKASGTIIKVKKFKADRLFGHNGWQKRGGGSKGWILHEAIKADRNWEGARRPNFTWISLSRFTTESKGLLALIASCEIRPSDLPLKSMSALKISPFYPDPEGWRPLVNFINILLALLSKVLFSPKRN